MYCLEDMMQNANKHPKRSLKNRIMITGSYGRIMSKNQEPRLQLLKQRGRERKMLKKKVAQMKSSLSPDKNQND